MAVIASPGWAQTSTRILDRFDDIAAWNAVASDGVAAALHPVVDAGRPAMRLDFDLGGTAGYAIARRALPLDLPQNYAITFWLRADAPVNDLQVKLVDASGDNVWWYNRPNFAFPREWQQVTIKKRQIEFAWGPTKDRTLSRAATIELVVAAGRGGGRGSVYVSDSCCASCRRCRPPGRDRTCAHPPRGEAGSPRAPSMARPRPHGGAIRRRAASSGSRWISVGHANSAVSSCAGRRASTHRATTCSSRMTAGGGAPCGASPKGGSGSAALLLTESDTRYLRLALHDGPRHSYALAELAVQDLAFGATPNAFFAALARNAPRGKLSARVLGRAGRRGRLSASMAAAIPGSSPKMARWKSARAASRSSHSSSSAARRSPGRTSIRGRSWSMTTCRCRAWSGALRAGRCASPRSQRGRPTTCASPPATTSTNLTDQPLSITLALAVRPFQVNPPAQFLNTIGGASPIHDLAWGERRADGEWHAQSLSAVIAITRRAAPVRRGAARAAAHGARRTLRPRRSRRFRLRVGYALLSRDARTACDDDARRRRPAQ